MVQRRSRPILPHELENLRRHGCGTCFREEDPHTFRPRLTITPGLQRPLPNSLCHAPPPPRPNNLLHLPARNMQMDTHVPSLLRRSLMAPLQSNPLPLPQHKNGTDHHSQGTRRTRVPSRSGQDRKGFQVHVPFPASYCWGYDLPCHYAPRGWRINDFAAIVPLANQVGCHALLPVSYPEKCMMELVDANMLM